MVEGKKRAKTDVERAKAHIERMKQQGIHKAFFKIHKDDLKVLQALAKSHGITQNELIGTMLAGQVKALMQVEGIVEVLPAEAASLIRHKARLLISEGHGILSLMEQIGSQTVEKMAESLPADEAESLRKKYDFYNLQNLREAQEGAA
ncbi:hypothetical protein V6U78_07265 [Marinospirillum sp. MEB164]|uniref:Uncharacterized protein n=1 Tax=Marinospirillum alkalitolerans TaxID=3123374 RepID=A0ABW8PYB5_9GAMM